MPHSIIYKHPSEDCPLCKRVKGRKGKADKEETLAFRCHSLAVYGSNYHNAHWVLRCEDPWKKCPGLKYHKRVLRAFKTALLEASKKLSSSRVVAFPRLVKVMRIPKVDLNDMDRQEPGNSLNPDRVVQGCLEHYGFSKIIKTRRNRKKKMWKITEEWYARRIS